MATKNPLINDNQAVEQPTTAPLPGTSTQQGDMFEIDLSEVSTSSAIPEGIYKVRCIEVEQSVSQSGNPMFVWTFTIIEGQHQGKDYKVYTVTTPSALWKVAEVVQALGVGQSGQVVKFKRSDVLNKECGAVIEDTEYQGSTRSQISKVIPLSEVNN